MSSEPPIRVPRRREDAHKGDFGRVGLVGGSRGMSGSIAMSAIASLSSGAGMVTAAVPDRILESVAQFHPGIMTMPLADDGLGRFSQRAASQVQDAIAGANAIGCGPGMGIESGAVRIVERLLWMHRGPRVFDADALNVIAAHRMLDQASEWGPCVLTPHPGELQRLTGISSQDRPQQIEAASRLADTHRIVIVVKGGPTVVVSQRERWTNSTGNPGMATAGSGDVLTGILAAMLAQQLPTAQAAKLAVWVHGRAGDLAARKHGQAGTTAVEIIGAIGTACSEATD